jgi:hypothetical protein
MSRLDAIEATSDELLGAYSKAEDDAMTTAFGARGRKRLNRVFDVIGFVYPDYCYPSRKQGKKRRIVASATSNAPKSKKVKVLTRRPRRIETVEVPKLIEGSASISEPSSSVPVGAKSNLIEEGGRAAEGLESTARHRIAEGIKDPYSNPCSNSEEEENGQRGGRCHGICKGINSYFC